MGATQRLGILFFLSILIQGCVCGEKDGRGNIGGMVAAVTAAFFCLIAVVVMIMVALYWRDWYMRRQIGKGRRRVPRDKPFWILKPQQSHPTTPASERKLHTHAADLAKYHSVGSRDHPRTDAWITSIPPANAFEEKAQTIDFPAEDDGMIIAEVLPEQNNYRQTTNLRSTTTTAPIQNLKASQSVYQSQTSGGFTVTKMPTPDMRTTYVPLNTSSAPAQNAAKLRQTAPAHVAMEINYKHPRDLSQTTRPTSQQSEHHFIQPSIPSGRKSKEDAGESGVVMFDSDDDAGNIPNPLANPAVLY